MTSEKFRDLKVNKKIDTNMGANKCLAKEHINDMTDNAAKLISYFPYMVGLF